MRRFNPFVRGSHFALGTFFLVGAAGLAQSRLESSTGDIPQSPKATVVKMTLHPAAAPVPAMKYMLLPEVRALTPGNAALLYQRAHSPEWWSHFLQAGHAEKVSNLLEMPLRKLPRETVVPSGAPKDPDQTDGPQAWAMIQQIVLGGGLKEIDRAARREYCDWELTPRLREEGYSLLIPDVQSFRNFGQIVALRTRVQMRDGQLDQAVESLQTGFALSRHVSEAPILINALVGMAVGNVMLNQVEEFVQLAKAPNLYWALADLPRPFIDLRRPLQGEKVGTDGMFRDIRAALKDPNQPPVSVHVIKGFIDRFGHLGVSSSHAGYLARDRIIFAVAAALAYPIASKFLETRGFSADQIQALPVTQVSLMYALALLDESYDEMYKWQSFPYWQARPGMKKAWQKFDQRRAEQPEGMYLAATLLPALEKVMSVKVRTDRRIAMLQVVEALRMYAVTEDAHFPERLEDIRAVPIPLDPVTGKAFEYTLEENRAILFAPPFPGEAASEHNAIRYELTLAPPTKK